MSIYDAVLSFIHEPRPEQFEPLALEVFRYQFAEVLPYREYCRGRGVTPATVRTVAEIPAVSTVAFKHARIENRTEATAAKRRVFMTSGTSIGFGERGRHLVPRPEIYRASAIAHLRRMLFTDGRRMAMLALHPTADRMPESSLSAMISWCIEEFGADPTLCAATAGGVDGAAALDFLAAAEAIGRPVCILATTAAFAALVRAIGGRRRNLRLAAGSRLMDTGGAKGQSIPLTATEVIAEAGRTLGLAPALVINEYGMTEMCSQLYDATPFNSAAAVAPPGFRMKLGPPWLRAITLDPVTLAPAGPGRVGMIAFFDLANVGSISAVMTEDFGVVRDGAVALIGRAAAGGARGCALSIDEFARVAMAQVPTPREAERPR
ncbi:MAG TPA: hypothetical protein VNF29_01255 [Candidatus Binataceae bacterium]|nr:hypothetical protein [Candidatus Binataceae bacterium]